MFLKNRATALAICFTALTGILSPAVSYAQDRRLPPGPRTILSRMLAVYSNAASYQDTGELRVVGDDQSLLEVLDAPQPAMEKPLSVSFTTLFLRQPGRFRFEWQNSWSKTTRPSAIWGDGKRVYSWDADAALGDDRFSLNEHEELSVAVAQMMTPSAGTAFIVPSLLLKEVAPYTFADVVRDLSDLRILRDETVDGVLCYVIRGRAPDAPWLLWVDKKTYYLRKVRSLFTAGISHGTNNRQFVAEQVHHNLNVNRRIPLKRFLYRPKIRRGDLDTSRLSYEPASVELHGRLTVELKYGPPNFGENPKTDKRVKVPIVVLTKAINIRGTPGAVHNAMPVAGARRIQLVFTDPAPDYKSLVGRDIVVKGTLFHAETGGHYTHVVMSVQSIEPKRRRA